MEHDDIFFKLKLNSIKTRCEYPKAINYKYYGGKGIKCLLSLDDIKFLWKRDNADTLKKPSIDRIDSNGNYELSNCRFVELRQNVLFRGVTKRLKPLLTTEQKNQNRINYVRSRLENKRKTNTCYHCPQPCFKDHCLCEKHMIGVRTYYRESYRRKKAQRVFLQETK